MTEIIPVPIESIRFVKELYPRIREDDTAIERYRTAISQLPPIIVARDNILVDGFHRWRAHVREEIKEIKAINLGNISDAEIFRESIKRNATHGLQLKAKDKENLACKLWREFEHLPEEDRYREIQDLLSLEKNTVEVYTRKARADEKREKQETAWDLWLDCHTQEQIAERVKVPRQTIADWCAGFRKNTDFGIPPNSRQHFDVWNFTMPKDSESTYFGRMPPQIVENLLWLYTKPGDTIFDPFAGGGTTIDVSKRMGRRTWASDRKPSTPTLPIHEHDITTGWPKDAPGKVDFILLDPPYWIQAEGKYSNDPEDLGNQDLKTFCNSWTKIVGCCRNHIDTNGHLAFIVSPAEDRKNDRVVDLAFLMYTICLECGYSPKRRIIVTYSTQQASGQQVEWARDGKKLLKQYRDLVVMAP